MHGAFFFACPNMSRTRLAPTPTNISTKSEPEIVKKGTFASPATARASSVFPVPWRAHQQHALRNGTPQSLELLRALQELHDFLQLFLRLVDPRDVVESDALLILSKEARPGFAKSECLAGCRIASGA